MQFNLGVIYYDGKYKSRNINKVIHYFKFAADQNFPDAQYNLGFIYYEGRHILPDLNKTIHYLTIENPIIGRKPLNSDVTQKDGTFDLNEWLQPGKMLTNGPSFYKIPSIGDVPPLSKYQLVGEKSAACWNSWFKALQRINSQFCFACSVCNIGRNKGFQW